MVDARTELNVRSRAIASGELPLPERFEGESDADWLTRIGLAALARATLPAVGDRFVVVADFWATEFLLAPRVQLHIGEVLKVVGHTALLKAPVARCQVIKDEANTVVMLDAESLARFTMPIPLTRREIA
jgi:hypothetical protein